MSSCGTSSGMTIYEKADLKTNEILHWSGGRLEIETFSF